MVAADIFIDILLHSFSKQDPLSRCQNLGPNGVFKPDSPIKAGILLLPVAPYPVTITTFHDIPCDADIYKPLPHALGLSTLRQALEI